MNYRATFREITACDIGRECPDIPEHDDFAMHIQAIAQDIATLDGVTCVSSQNDRVVIIQTSGLNIEDVKLRLKPILQQHYRYARIDHIDTL